MYECNKSAQSRYIMLNVALMLTVWCSCARYGLYDCTASANTITFITFGKCQRILIIFLLQLHSGKSTTQANPIVTARTRPKFVLQ